MAITRITKGVIKPNENYDTHNIVSTGIVTSVGLDVNGNADVSGSLSVGGVLTYEDVTSIDSVGIITARSGLVSPYADIDDFVSVGSNIHLGNAGVITATSFVGDGSNLTNTGSTLSEPSSGTQRLVTTSLTTGTMTSSGTGSELAFDYANNHLEFSDGTRATFGTDNDLQLYHSGSNAFFTNSTGFFRIANTTGGLYLDGNGVTIRSEAGDENYAIFNNDGAVELYHNNVKRLETSSVGVSIPQDLDVDGHTNLDNVSVAGVTTFAENVIAQKKLSFADSPYIGSTIPPNSLRFGNNDDLILYHTGNYSGIDERGGGSGGLVIHCTNNFTVKGNASNKLRIKAIEGGATELYHNNVKRLETTNQGINVIGHSELDNVNISGVTTTAGNVDINADLDVDGHTNLDNVNIAGVTTTTGNVNVGGYVVSQGTSGRGGIFGQVEVGYDGTYLTIQPTSGHNDLHLNFDNGSTVQIGHTNGSTLTVNGNIKPKTDSASDLGLTGTRFRAAYVDTYYGDGSNLTGISGVTINSNADNRIITGSGTAATLNAESSLTYNGTTISNSAGGINLQSTGGDLINVTSTNAASRSTIKFNTNGNDWEIGARGSSADNPNNFYFYSNSTSNYRLLIDSAGQVLPGADDAQNLGSSTKRWANIYAADMHYSNEGGENSVDGTWGSYTIQEGESDLYLLNNRNGKKYKFVLQEVS